MIEAEDQREIAEKLMQHIIDKREENKLCIIKTEATSLADAQELASVDATGHTISTIVALQEQFDRANSDDQKIEKYFMYAIIIMVIGIIPLIYHMVMKG